jgi:hypothetical protein
MEGNFLMLWYQNAPVACLRKPSLEEEEGGGEKRGGRHFKTYNLKS